MPHKILPVDPRFARPDRQAYIRQFIHPGFEVTLPASFDRETLLREARAAAAIITGMAPITAEIMAAAPGLRVVGKVGTGVDSIDVAAATARKIPVANAPGWLRCVPVAEHAFTLMLMSARRPWLWRTPERRFHVQLEGSTLGIVGLGNIGQAVAARGAAFGMKLLAHTRTRGKFRPRGFEVTECASLEELLPQADFVVLALPLTPESGGLIGRRELALMKPTAILVNVSRGPHVVTQDLADALREGRIAGAGLDVTEPEPLPEGHPLWEMPQVVISPHVAANTDGVQRASFKLLFDSIRRAVNGERVESLANPQIYS
ncbi:MAG: NAD(P)-dependent oxidoreductase [Nitrospinota bacterium]